MNSLHFRKYKYFMAGVLVFTHLVICSLAPWFHQHLDEDHAGAAAHVHHSHILPSVFPVLAGEPTHHDTHDVRHFLEGFQPLDLMRVSNATHSGRPSATGNQTPPHNITGILPSSIFLPPSFAKTAFKPPLTRPHPKDFTLSATDLSPPLA